MKKYFSVFALAVQQSFYKILGILGIMTIVEFGVFLTGKEWYDFEGMVRQSHLRIFFFLAFLLVTVCLILTNVEQGGSRERYLLKRLSMDERTIVVLWSIYGALVYLIFLAVQVAVVIGMGLLFLRNAPANYQTGQSIFIAFMSEPFLHSVLPVFEPVRMVRNLCIALMLGMETAVFGWHQRNERRNPLFLYVAIGVVCGGFVIDMTNPTDYLMIVFSIVVMVVMVLELCGIWGKEKYED